MIRTIERAKTHYEVFMLDKGADAKTMHGGLPRARRRAPLHLRRVRTRGLPVLPLRPRCRAPARAGATAASAAAAAGAAAGDSLAPSAAPEPR